MFRKPYHKFAFLLVVAMIVSLGATVAASQQEMHKKIQPRELTRTVTSSYGISQTDKVIGSETVIRSDYSDNSIVFLSTVTLKPAEGIEIVVESELTVEAESHFPIRYKMKKNVLRGGSDLTQENFVDLYSNVAVFRAKMGEGEKVVRKVIPAGTAFIGGNASSHYYQLLYWYNRDLGGRQTFDVLDLDAKLTNPVVFHMTTAEDVVVSDETITATVFILEQEKRSPVKIYVDENDRIVKFEKNFMIYELTEWSEKTGRASGK
jgi:hypothetical protein